MGEKWRPRPGMYLEVATQRMAYWTIVGGALGAIIGGVGAFYILEDMFSEYPVLADTLNGLSVLGGFGTGAGLGIFFGALWYQKMFDLIDYNNKKLY